MDLGLGGKVAVVLPQMRARRWGEMGFLVAFLCWPKAAFVTGETIRIDGGYTKSLF
jgi:3-oxoacyl-[acyl-carrier protein] reductase